MSFCKNSIRAFSRHRIPSQGSSTFKSLLPFLYQTATIQQWNPVTSLVSHRFTSSRYRHYDDIPFESSESLPPSIDGSEAARPRKTTITSTERAAFQKLYRKVKVESEPDYDIPFVSSSDRDRIFDEYSDEDDNADTAGSDLDSVFDAVLAGIPPGSSTQRSRPRKPFENLETLAKSILKPEVEEVKGKSREQALEEAARIKSIREEEKKRVVELLDRVQTDREIWEVLQREVFDMIKKLDLDGLNASIAPKKKHVKKAKPVLEAEHSGTIFESLNPNPTTGIATPLQPPSRQNVAEIDPRILFPNYPTLLIYAVHLLRRHFPSSPLPLTILPTIKSLGRSSYALGATTALYNLLIRTAWLQHSSYDYIDELLTDMDNGGIEFDLGTLDLLNKILFEYNEVRGGKFGHLIREVWNLEQFHEGARKLDGWRGVARQRLGAWAGKRAREGSLIRKYEEPGSSSLRGPRDEIGVEPGIEEEGRGVSFERQSTPRWKHVAQKSRSISAIRQGREEAKNAP
ncbi:uncharacterized protein BDR25DRAFT_299628 [Lindgomyces ingoldianus]|uniref:Uncharacterized protein n=1 Tax=Lindgomyces ingoldianus TaxID=673940 RepID=A0ACB6RET7_9PLEO|nr:uncharacterized protein BDR25DRAFT_299628 [Lindgomyces ingoldianus]KAF2477859.1 hypothetical protein BDR25DRAFT_299628 [Lindgomyces ingoldianus]